ncbi:hypothetical protein SDC9_188704 [bioreactor metagenome]|uniref:Uncharacterized protein n=1 Tax=bioreactor metagenome TaxID=1076179 RepID=A0A645HRP3_9ZZZZ
MVKLHPGISTMPGGTCEGVLLLLLKAFSALKSYGQPVVELETPNPLLQEMKATVDNKRKILDRMRNIWLI